ncbi:hypothetical protein [Streptomyces sp. NPDC016845]|uniref:NucA/NucB deoxyribonuclease domain-containing protein n=1 Tax=Streptomyces sp. NPDC016845 TaxID=3364972 RepID=UPI0037A4B8CB
MEHGLRRVLIAVSGGLILAAASINPTVAAPMEPQGETTVIQGYTTDPRYVGNPGAVLDALERGVSPEELGAGKAGQRHELPRTEAEARRMRENSGQSYAVEADDYRPGVEVQEDPHNFETCLKNRDKATAPGGWVRSHFAWCQAGTAWAQVSPPGGGLARVEADIYLVGYGKQGPVPGSSTDRYLEFQMRAHEWRFRGIGSGARLWETHPEAQLDMRIECIPTDDSDWDSCEDGDRNGRNDTIQNWLSSGWAEAQLVSEAKTPRKGHGQQIQRATVYGKFVFSIPGFETDPDQSTSGSTSIRFDSAWYITGTAGAKKQGSIFESVDPFLAYSNAADSGYKKVADHIAKALNDPGSTMPPRSDKKIPGGAATFPNHRLAPSVSSDHRKRYRANRYDKGLACDAHFEDWKDEVDDDGAEKECDEFPFASTYEGAARARPEYSGGNDYVNWFSVQPLSRTQNGLAGRILGKWYNDDRILDSDAFHIKVR